MTTQPDRCERCGQAPDKACYMPERRCPRPATKPIEQAENDEQHEEMPD